MNFPFISSNVPTALEYGIYNLFHNLSDIPELLVPIRISVIKVAANKEASEPRVPSGQFEVIPSTVLT